MESRPLSVQATEAPAPGSMLDLSRLPTAAFPPRETAGERLPSEWAALSSLPPGRRHPHPATCARGQLRPQLQQSPQPTLPGLPHFSHPGAISELKTPRWTYSISHTKPFMRHVAGAGQPERGRSLCLPRPRAKTPALNSECGLMLGGRICENSRGTWFHGRTLLGGRVE